MSCNKQLSLLDHVTSWNNFFKKTRNVLVSELGTFLQEHQWIRSNATLSKVYDLVFMRIFLKSILKYLREIRNCVSKKIAEK